MTEAPPEHPRPRRTVPAGAFVLVLAVAAALAVLAVVALTADGGGADDDRDVRLAAGRFTERFLTFRHDGLDEWEQDVRRLSTPGFGEEVDEVRESLRALISDGRLDAETQVVDVFVGEEDRGAIGVVVVYDRTVVGEDVDREETDRYLQLGLVRIDGAWLVDEVIDIATAGDAAGPVVDLPEGSSPTTAPSTTAPATTASTAPPG